MFVSSVYRRMIAGADDCSPVLARYDRIIEHDRQRPSYEGLSLSVLDRGHVTGSFATDRLREHVLHILSTCDADRVGRG